VTLLRIVDAKPNDFLSLPKNSLITSDQAAAALNLQPNTLAIWRTTKKYSLPYIKVGRRVCYRVGDILEFLESRTQNI